MKRVSKLVFIGMAVLAIVLGVAISESLAATFTLWGINDPNLRADVLFVYTPGKIEISIKNTSLPAAGLDPRFTGFAFNVPVNVTGLSFNGPTGWSGLYDKDDINTPMPLGKFDMAGFINPNFLGGNPNYGIPLYSTYNFSFFLTGTNLNLLTENSFLSLLSSGGSNPQSFAGRFQQTGIDGERSDAAVVPVPATLLLLGSGLIGIGLFGRGRFKK